MKPHLLPAIVFACAVLSACALVVGYQVYQIDGIRMTEKGDGVVVHYTLIAGNYYHFQASQDMTNWYDVVNFIADPKVIPESDVRLPFPSFTKCQFRYVMETNDSFTLCQQDIVETNGGLMQISRYPEGI